MRRGLKILSDGRVTSDLYVDYTPDGRHTGVQFAPGSAPVTIPSDYPDLEIDLLKIGGIQGDFLKVWKMSPKEEIQIPTHRLVLPRDGLAYLLAVGQIYLNSSRTGLQPYFIP